MLQSNVLQKRQLQIGQQIIYSGFEIFSPNIFRQTCVHATFTMSSNIALMLKQFSTLCQEFSPLNTLQVPLRLVKFMLLEH